MTQAETQLLTVLEKRLHFETILTEISARFVKLNPNEVDQEIECALQQVLVFFGADRCGLLEGLAAPYSMQVTHAAYGPDIERFSPEIYLANSFPWHYHRLFVDRQPVSFELLKDLPSEAEKDRQTAVAMGIRSMLSIPVSYDNRISHILMFQTLSHEHHWPEEYVSRLRLLVEILVSALTRKKADEASLEREAFLSLAADSADAGLWSLDLTTNLFWVTAKTRAIFGFTPDESLSFDRFLEVVHPNDREPIKKLVDQAIRSHKDISSEYRIILPDGNERWMLSWGRLHFNSSGDPERLMGVSIDITEPKRTEMAIAEEKQFNETLINSLPGIFYLYDSEGNIIRWNQNHERLTGFSPEELKDRKVLDWFTGDETKKIIADNVERTFAEGSVTVEASLTLKDGSQVPYLFTATRLETSEGRFFLGMGMDITEQKKAFLKLENALKEIQSLKDRLKEENLYLQQEIREKIYIGDFTGESDVIQDLLQKAKRVAPTDSAVLITGETGTGKELLARAIHSMSLRRDRQMITVNCAALPSTLIEGELFGREKGAYTGAITQQKGRFEIADGSTIFLDEIGDLPPALQVKLLRVLETGEFERLGSYHKHTVDVRLIAATNRDLPKMIEAGKFRSDLYYRLNVFPLYTPPLRERREDIPVSCQNFI